VSQLLLNVGCSNSIDKATVNPILSGASIFNRAAGRPDQFIASPDLLRRVKRLIWFALVACVALISTLDGNQDLAQQLSVRVSLAVILVASWAIVMHITVYVRGEDLRRASEAETARLEGARMTASAMQDRIANKLSLTVGYAEFLVFDPRMPEDLREHAQRAIDGARAAAEQMSELKRLTRRDHEARKCDDTAPPQTPGAYDSDRLRELMLPLKGDAS